MKLSTRETRPKLAAWLELLKPPKRSTGAIYDDHAALNPQTPKSNPKKEYFEMTTGKQVFSTITSAGQLELSIADIEIPTPGPDDVVVRIDAAPINPSDMGPLFGPASIDKANLEDTKLVAPVPENRLGMVAARLDQTLPVGNECAGTIVATGDSEAARALDGKLVSIMPGASFAQYACVPAATCLVHNDETTPQRAASSFVNPLTALCFLETMRMENHTGLLHTAQPQFGANAGRLCAAEDVPLVNIVRSEEQAATLRALEPSIFAIRATPILWTS